MESVEFACLRSEELYSNYFNAYQELFHRAFNSHKSEDKFIRQFLPGPEGYGYHGVIISKNKLLGAFNGIVSCWEINNKIHRSVVIVDAMMDPDIQRKGMIKPMLQILYTRLQSDGFSFLTGMPNARFYPVLTQGLGWEDLGHLNWLLAFPEFKNKFKSPSSSQLFFRRFNPTFPEYRFNSTHIELISPEGKIWLKPQGPALAILIDGENRNPEALRNAHQWAANKLKKVIIFPSKMLGLSNSFKIPEWIVGNRTCLAIHRLNPDLPADFANKLLFTLGDFDVS
jgi:hypothetical protein